MDYRVEPTGLTRRSGRSVLIGVSVGIVVLGMVLAYLAVSGPAVLPPTVAQASAGPTPSPTPLPAITCHDLERSRCTHVAEAALAVIDDPTLPGVRRVEVWATLLCGDVLDCPPGRLGDREVAGSAVIGLIDDRALWVNVTDLGRGAFDAWVVRTQPRG